MQFRVFGVLILLKLSNMIARKIFLQKLLLEKVSLDIDVTMSLYLLSLTEESTTVLHSLLPLGKEGEWHLMFHSRWQRAASAGHSQCLRFAIGLFSPVSHNLA